MKWNCIVADRETLLDAHQFTIFLASRFDEFEDIRHALHDKITSFNSHGFALKAVNLNDRQVSADSPITRSLGYVRESDVMILLLGDTYGSVPKGYDQSYTHLEYEEACKDENGVDVLVFCIGRSYADGKISYSDDTRLAAWQRDIQDNQTIGFYQPTQTPDEISKDIFQRLLENLYELSLGKIYAEQGEEEAILEVAEAEEDESSFGGKNEIEYLSKMILGKPTNMLESWNLDTNSTLSAMAAEWVADAAKARSLGNYRIAAQNLQRALEYKPLNWDINIDLAELYAKRGSRKRLFEAKELALQASQIAESQQLSYHAAYGYIIASEASRKLEDKETALAYSQRAMQTMGDRVFVSAYIEHARNLLLADRKQESLDYLKTVLRISTAKFRTVLRDPFFNPVRNDINKMIRQYKVLLIEKISPIIDNERLLLTLTANPRQPLSVDVGQSLQSIVETARTSLRNQRGLVAALFGKAETLHRQLETSVNNIANNVFRLPENIRGLEIVRWQKKEGDIVTHGDTLFVYRWKPGGDQKEWQYSGNSVVRIYRILNKSGIANQDNRNLCTFVPENYVIPQPTQYDQYCQRLEQMKLKLKLLQEATEVLQRRRTAVTLGSIFLMLAALLLVVMQQATSMAFFSLFIGTMLLIYGFKYSGYRTLRLKHFVSDAQINRRWLFATKEETKTLIAVEVKRREEQLADAAQFRTQVSESLRQFIRLLSRQPNKLFPFGSRFSQESGKLLRVAKDDDNITIMPVLKDFPKWLGIDYDNDYPTYWLGRITTRPSDRQTVLSLRGFFDEA